MVQPLFAPLELEAPPMDASAEVAEAPAIAAAETTAPAVAVGAPPADTINGESGETEVAGRSVRRVGAGACERATGCGTRERTD
jgi:hypothetical protein